MKFGSWTEDISRVDLRMVGLGANTTVYWQSVEWDLLGLPALRFLSVLKLGILLTDLNLDSFGYHHARKYNCCDEIYPDIAYVFRIRRLPLFYTIHLVIPCLLLTSITGLVFYLPSDSSEKVEKPLFDDSYHVLLR